MATQQLYKDASGRVITDTAYQAQQKAGTDISGIQKVGTTIVEPKQIDTNSSVYKEAITAGKTPEEIQTAYTKQLQAGVPEIKTTPTQIEGSNIDKGVFGGLQAGTAPGVKTEATKSEIATQKPDYFDVSTARQNEIISNLNAYQTSNPNLFKDEETFKKFFDVGTGDRVAKQDQWMLDWYKSKVTDVKQVETNNKIKTDLSSLSDSALGQITPTAEQLSAINGDPELYAKYTQAKKNQSIIDQIYNNFPKADETKIDGLDQLPGNIANEITLAKNIWNTENSKLLQIKTQLDNKEATIRASLDSKGYSESYIQAKINKEKRELTNEYNSQVNVLNASNSKVSLLSDEAKAKADELKAEQDAFTAQVDALKTAYGISTDITTQDLATQKAKKELEATATDKNIGKTTDVKIGKNTYTYQWNPETQRFDIPVGNAPVVGSAGTGKGGTGISVPGQITSGEEAINTLEDASFWMRKASQIPGSGFVSPEIEKINAAYDYIVNKLSLQTFVEAKKNGATFGSMTEGEWKLIQGASSMLRKGLNEKDRNTQMGIIRNTMNIARNRAISKGQIKTETNQSTIPQTTNKTNSSYGLDFGSMFSNLGTW